MDTKKLRAARVLYGDDVATLAGALGLSQQTFEARLNGQEEFTVGNIQAIVRRYQFPTWLTEAVFFPDYAKECSHAAVEV